jgi:hypothetical protein
MMTPEEEFRNISLTAFLERIDRDKCFWLIKRLSGNDTGLTGGHQVGIYCPRFFMEKLMPEICTTELFNPTKAVDCYIASQDYMAKNVKAKYYNSKYHPDRKLKKKYDEFRLTSWGGKKAPIQNPEYTGSICMLAIMRTPDGVSLICWISNNEHEEDLFEYWMGEEVEPGHMYSPLKYQPQRLPVLKRLPEEWFGCFPTGREIFNFVELEIPQDSWNKSIDELLLTRRRLEFDIFSEVEKRDVIPNIKNGFISVDEFIKYSHSVSNRRKSRTGTSLELNLESIFSYEKLIFETQVVTEQKKKPDFLFPSGKDYHNPAFPETKLHMLAAKTCCKDRWRQIINEANRIKEKHLFTLQEGVSEPQFKEMTSEGIILVVPESTKTSFPKSIRKDILSLQQFTGFIKKSQEN